MCVLFTGVSQVPRTDLAYRRPNCILLTVEKTNILMYLYLCSHIFPFIELFVIYASKIFVCIVHFTIELTYLNSTRLVLDTQ